MNKRKVLIIYNQTLMRDILEFILDKLSYISDSVDHPIDAVKKIEKTTYGFIIIGENKGTIVKSKLAEILHSKASSKPHIIIYKEPGEIIPKEPYITILRKPTFHDELIETLNTIGLKPILPLQQSKIDPNDFVENKKFERINIFDFFKQLKGNIKYHIKKEGKNIVGFTMGVDLYIIYSDLENPYTLLSLGAADIATEPLTLSEFLSLPIDSTTFKTNTRDFLVKSVSLLNDKSKLLSLLPNSESVVVLKAPTYVLNQIDLIKNNLNLYEITSNKELTIHELTNSGNNIDRIKALVCMYLLNMITTKESRSANNKYDVKIKKSFLKKIMDKIRGL